MRPTAFACILASLMSNFVAIIRILDQQTADAEPNFISFIIGAFLVPATLATAGVLLWRSGEPTPELIKHTKKRRK